MSSLSCVSCGSAFPSSAIYLTDCPSYHKACFPCMRNIVAIADAASVQPRCPGAGTCDHELELIEIEQILGGRNEVYDRFAQRRAKMFTQDAVEQEELIMQNLVLLNLLNQQNAVADDDDNNGNDNNNDDEAVPQRLFAPNNPFNNHFREAPAGQEQQPLWGNDNDGNDDDNNPFDVVGDGRFNNDNDNDDGFFVVDDENDNNDGDHGGAAANKGKQKEQEDEHANQYECNICYDWFDIGDMYEVECDDAHRFCFGCLGQHVRTTIESDRLPRCPLCDHELSYNEMQQILDPDQAGNHHNVLEKANELLLQLALEGDDTFVRCPQPGCDFAVVVAHPGEQELCVCQNLQCRFEFCSLCSKLYHYRATCAAMAGLQRDWNAWKDERRAQELRKKQDEAVARAEYERRKAQRAENEASEREKARICKRCPKCRRPIFRHDGCGAMVCGRDADTNQVVKGCGHKFNWTENALPYEPDVDDEPLEDPRVAQQQAQQQAQGVKHELYRCDQCNEEIVGIRFNCVHCPAYNLCIDCDAQARHDQAHIFRLITVVDGDYAQSPQTSQRTARGPQPTGQPAQLFGQPARTAQPGQPLQRTAQPASPFLPPPPPLQARSGARLPPGAVAVLPMPPASLQQQQAGPARPRVPF